jgi:hypothetical protein
MRVLASAGLNYLPIRNHSVKRLPDIGLVYARHSGNL